ncbi:GNAT family N-acetyltransferase [Hoeflea sp.]|uniref:GNAT family N-acetyltransferase n=1 Tax=Hoeflea sp. TaxID=1940281 RepID=UPI0025C69AA9|nr:GNAT family N-acetyltransferase [Hoeflea sp.]
MPVVFEGYRPGALAGVLGLHMDYYAREWGFGLAFETKLAAELAQFLGRFDPGRDLFLTAWRDGALAGSISMDVSGGGIEGAHLRWFVVADSARGAGLGKQLLARAIHHADSVSAGPVWLTTFAGLDAARALYESFGFRLQAESDADQWQGGVREQSFLRPGPSPASPAGFEP